MSTAGTRREAVFGGRHRWLSSRAKRDGTLSDGDYWDWLMNVRHRSNR